MIGLSAACLLALVLSGKATNITVIAVSGDTAPAAGLDKVYTQFLNPAINEAGDVVYGATVTNASGQQFRSLWMISSGVQSLIGLQGENAPGTSAQYSSFSDNRPALTEDGTVLFDARLTGAGITFENDRGMWIGKPGAVLKLIREGDPVPTLPDVTVNSLSFFIGQAHRMSPSGRPAFRMLLDGFGVADENNSALFVGRVGTLQLLAREGDQAPGLANGIVYDTLQGATPYLNDTGTFAFQSEVRGFDFGVTDDNDGVIWSGSSAGLQGTLRESEIDPTTGVAYVDLRGPFINRDGTLAFVSGLASGPDDDTGIWLENPRRLIAREGDVAPGTGGERFGDFTAADPFLNNLGQVVFNADIEGPTVLASADSAIYAGDANQLTLVAREGDQAPEFADGVRFRELRFRSQLFNSAGQVIFLAEVIGTGINNNNNGALWSSEVGGATRLLVREGDSIEVAPEDIRTIREIRLAGGGGDGDGTNTSFNNAGVLVFTVIFSDFSWALVSTKVERTGLLSLALTGDDLVLSWQDSGFTLETTPTLITPWTNAFDQSTPQILLPSAAEIRRYFRLRRP